MAEREQDIYTHARSCIYTYAYLIILFFNLRNNEPQKVQLFERVCFFFLSFLSNKTRFRLATLPLKTIWPTQSLWQANEISSLSTTGFHITVLI